MRGDLNNMKPIKSVLLVGGTHGNELTGVHFVKQSKKQELGTNYNSFSLDYLIANELAIKANQRYIDTDLNRCFKLTDLNDSTLTGKENKLARSINEKIGPKGSSKTDFIIDLHTSTSNMQTNIVITRTDLFHLQLASYLKQILPDVTVTSEAELMDDHHFLESIAPNGVLIEIGPIPQGCIEYDCYEKTLRATRACLDFIELFNGDSLPSFPDTLNTQSYHSKLYFPTDENGDICASVHPSLIGKAYPKLKEGDPIFKRFDGTDILYEGESTFLAFINEAAYYDKKIAMCLCNPIIFSLSSANIEQ